MSSRKTNKAAEEEQLGFEARLINWVHKNQRILTYVASGIAVIALVVWWLRVADTRKNLAADQVLSGARVQMQTGNFGDAATELSRVRDTFGGTTASHEAVLLLNELRLTLGQAALAAQDLAGYAAGSPVRFRARAYQLLGAAHEDAGNAVEAAVAYGLAAEAAQYDHEVARALLDAGRAHTVAGDTTAGIAAYREITTNHPESPVVLDARLRLAELEGAIRQ